MATRKTLHEYYLQQHGNIDKYLEQCLNKADNELIHELRLSIKKLRAFNKLAGQLFMTDKHERIKLKHRVDELYKLSGQLRDTQVQIHLLDDIEEQEGNEYHEFKNWLLSREKKKIKRFSRKSRHMDTHATSQLHRDKISQLLAEPNELKVVECADKVLTGLFVKARKLSEGKINDLDLHRIRISTKQIRYILNIVQQCYPDFEFNKISVDSLREIETAAGLWHDNLVRVEYLSRCIEKVALTDNTELLKYQKFIESCNNDLKSAYLHTCAIVKSHLA
jgi:CHAD domain-containing protein